MEGISVDEEELEAARYLKEIEVALNTACFRQTEAEFNYSLDMKEETSEAKVVATKEATEVKRKIQLQLISKFPHWKQYKNQDIRHQVGSLRSSGPANMSVEEVLKMVRLQSEIAKLRSKARICDFVDRTNCSLRLKPGIYEKLTASAKNNTNMEATEYYWTEAHNVVGKSVAPEMYHEFIQLSNNYAKANDYANMMALWLASFDDYSEDWTTEGFQNELKQTLDEFMPYYKKLHAYVRMKLKQSRGDSLKMPENGYMYMHIFGSMDEIGSDWSLLASETRPYPDARKVEIDEALKEANYTPRKIIEVAEQFFTGLNEDWKLPESVWEKSLFERPEDKNRAVSCHPVATDFCMKNHFRLHMCITVSESDLKLAYHEVGHIFYFMQYQDLPIAFRDGANLGFHEAIGDAIQLSVTPKHLKCVLKLNIEAYSGIDCDNGKQAETYPIDHNDINILYSSALFKLPKLPFALAVDLWRTKVFSGEISPQDYNKEWWKIREELQGMVPPTPRPPDNLDAIVLFHTAANIPYIIYFTSLAFQFQFYEALCIAAGQYDPNDPQHTAPLHRCDYANSKEAGKLLKDMLAKGASQSWKSILHKFTGSRDMSLRPLLNYYQPLFDHIDKELKENNFPVCFGKYCKSN